MDENFLSPEKLWCNKWSFWFLDLTKIKCYGNASQLILGVFLLMFLTLFFAIIGILLHDCGSKAKKDENVGILGL